MRYSKAKMIAAAVITFIALIVVGFGIYKGIDYSKNLSEGTEPKKAETKKVLASVSNKKDTKKTVKKTKTESKKEEKKVETKKTETTKKEATKKETVKKEEPKKEVEQEYSDSRVGLYKVIGLKVKNKEYSKEELDKLKKAGYSLRLDVNDKGLATIAVLSINKMFEFTDDHLYDGEKEIAYTYKKNKLNITIDDYEIVFEKE